MRKNQLKIQRTLKNLFVDRWSENGRSLKAYCKKTLSKESKWAGIKNIMCETQDHFNRNSSESIEFTYQYSSFVSSSVMNDQLVADST